MGKAGDALLAGRKQLLAGEFRRGVEIEAALCWPSSISASVAKACRCASLPGDTCSVAVSTSMKSRREEAAQRRLNPVPADQETTAVGMDARASTRGAGFGRSWVSSRAVDISRQLYGFLRP
jgi:hypothetical protein